MSILVTPQMATGNPSANPRQNPLDYGKGQPPLRSISARLKSPVSRYLPSTLGALVLLGCLGSIVSAQQLSVVIRVRPETPRRALIEGNCPPATVWSFRDSYAGVNNLGARIEDVHLFDAAGADIQARKIAPGQFEAAKPASKFRYEVNLNPPARASDAALVSWLNADRGVLRLADLLPLTDRTATEKAGGEARDNNRSGERRQAAVRMSLPAGWTVHSNEATSQTEFNVLDIDSAVFALGRQLRTSHTTVSKTTLNLIIDGEWAFADADALEMAARVVEANTRVMSGRPANQATLILFPSPQSVAADRWSAETRGSTVTLLMERLPSKTAALAQLSVPLTHELFHLWIPNALALQGDYDWFYEGFTVYQSARTAVRLGLLTFQEFLIAIARAHDAYAVGLDRDRWSLIEASQRRWTTGGSAVYQKSMLVAFILDLKLRSQSHSKRSLDGLYREIFTRYRSVGTSAVATDGNQAVVTIIESTPGMEHFAETYVRRAAVIDLQGEISPFGLNVERLGLRTRISVSQTLTRQQRDLLRELGYNDSVRTPATKKR
jgi:predicted metalloprotease with PDZ domain